MGQGRSVSSRPRLPLVAPEHQSCGRRKLHQNASNAPPPPLALLLAFITAAKPPQSSPSSPIKSFILVGFLASALFTLASSAIAARRAFLVPTASHDVLSTFHHLSANLFWACQCEHGDAKHSLPRAPLANDRDLQRAWTRKADCVGLCRRLSAERRMSRKAFSSA